MSIGSASQELRPGAELTVINKTDKPGNSDQNSEPLDKMSTYCQHRIVSS